MTEDDYVRKRNAVYQAGEGLAKRAKWQQEMIERKQAAITAAEKTLAILVAQHEETTTALDALRAEFREMKKPKPDEDES